VVIGCNNFGGRIDADRATGVVHAALDQGINFFDTADSYGQPVGRSETILGAALGSRRDDVVVATKFAHDLRGANGPDWGARGSRRYIMRAVEASLRRLGTDYIDLYQMHYPDPLTPVGETLSALDDLVRSGKVRYIGNSNFAGWQIADADWVAATDHLTRFVSAQNQYSLLTRAAESDVIPACARFGLGLLPYFPLESGLLTGKYHRGQAAPAGSRLARDTFAAWLARAPWNTIKELEAFADKRGISLLHVSFGWLLAQPTVASVIAGATSAEQVAANVVAATWQPTDDDLSELRTILNVVASMR
jgi:aryl-alcohol dehydrogenase-like predicted oxidoreductase